MQSTESLISLCFNMQLSKFGGDVAIGSMTILTSVMQFAMMPLQGLTQGGQPIISYNFGAKNADRVKKRIFTSNTMLFHIRKYHLAFSGIISSSIYFYFHKRFRLNGNGKLGHSYLYGMRLIDGASDFLPTNLHCIWKCQDFSIFSYL